MPTFSKKQNEVFRRICKLTENSVFTMMRKLLITSYGRDNIICDNEFIIAKGDIPVALVAHCDTVFPHPPKDIFYDKEANVMWSPQGLGADDRAGIYAIIQIINDDLKPHIIITTGEESGCIGSGKIVGKMTNHPFDDLKFMVQLDRRGFRDSVFYQCDNIDFENFVNNFGFETNYGSLSDISVLAPVWGIAAVNFSVGYMDEHSKEERLYVDALFNTIDKVGRGSFSILDLNLFLQEKEVTYLPKEADLLFIRLDRERKGQINLSAFVREISPRLPLIVQ